MLPFLLSLSHSLSQPFSYLTLAPSPVIAPLIQSSLNSIDFKSNRIHHVLNQSSILHNIITARPTSSQQFSGQCYFNRGSVQVRSQILIKFTKKIKKVFINNQNQISFNNFIIVLNDSVVFYENNKKHQIPFSFNQNFQTHFAQFDKYIYIHNHDKLTRFNFNDPKEINTVAVHNATSMELVLNEKILQFCTQTGLFKVELVSLKTTQNSKILCHASAGYLFFESHFQNLQVKSVQRIDNAIYLTLHQPKKELFYLAEFDSKNRLNIILRLKQPPKLTFYNQWLVLTNADVFVFQNKLLNSQLDRSTRVWMNWNSIEELIPAMYNSFIGYSKNQLYTVSLIMNYPTFDCIFNQITDFKIPFKFNVSQCPQVLKFQKSESYCQVSYVLNVKAVKNTVVKQIWKMIVIVFVAIVSIWLTIIIDRRRLSKKLAALKIQEKIKKLDDRGTQEVLNKV